MAHRERIIEMAREFRTAFLVTSADDSPRARPMGVGKFEDDGTIYFCTQKGSGKVDEIEDEAEVLVTMQGKVSYVTLRGLAEVITDREEIKAHWQDSWDIWFEQESSDPNAVVLRVTPMEGEFWDLSSAKGVRFAFNAVKAYLTGGTADEVEGTHGQADL